MALRFNCQIIAHDVTDYRWLHPKKVVEKVYRGKTLVHPPKQLIHKCVERGIQIVLDNIHRPPQISHINQPP